MKIFFTLLTLAMFVMLEAAAMYYAGPWDERISPYKNPSEATLGWYAQNANAVAVLDVIETGTNHVNSDFGYIKTRVVNALYGCTNGQELVILKLDTNPYEMRVWDEDLNIEFYPTNNSRIVCAIIAWYPIRKLPPWTPTDWKRPTQPEIIVSSTNSFLLMGDIRCWWPDGYQDNLPLTHLTNLLYSAQVERNWTNFYYKIRDAVPTPTSPRVWQDSFSGIVSLLRHATHEQFEFIRNDPLFPAECQEIMQDIYERHRRYGEDE